MKIVIETIPHHEQRYVTAGDYWDDSNGKQVRVSELGDWRMELLVAIHELIETALCDVRGIAEPDVMAFDMAHPDADDPGSLPEAPYHKEHMFAEEIEHLIADELGVDWTDYETRVGALFE